MDNRILQGVQYFGLLGRKSLLSTCSSEFSWSSHYLIKSYLTKLSLWHRNLKRQIAIRPAVIFLPQTYVLYNLGSRINPSKSHNNIQTAMRSQPFSSFDAIQTLCDAKWGPVLCRPPLPSCAQDPHLGNETSGGFLSSSNAVEASRDRHRDIGRPSL